MLHLLVPTTDLTNEYHEALTCGLTGTDPAAQPAALTQTLASPCIGRLHPGASNAIATRSNLPKVAATGGPQCNGAVAGAV